MRCGEEHADNVISISITPTYGSAPLIITEDQKLDLFYFSLLDSNHVL